MRKSSQRHINFWFVGFVTVNLLASTPQTVEAFFGNDDHGDDGFVEILAAGLITKLLMEDFESGGGGGGGSHGRSSLLRAIGERLALIGSRHRQYMGGHTFLKYSFPQQPIINEPAFHPAEMQLHPKYFFSGPGSLLIGDSSMHPMLGMPFEGYISEPLSPAPSMDFVGISSPFGNAPPPPPPIFIDEGHNIRSLPSRPDVIQARADGMRHQYILPRIVRHFVQRLMRRAEQH